MDDRNTARHCRVLIGSAGRRAYLIRWFKAGLHRLGLRGEVIITENDPTSTAFAVADSAYRVPRYDDHRYRDSMIELISDLRPNLFFSVNDYELDILADGLADTLRGYGTTVLSLELSEQRIAADKFQIAQFLTGHGIATPRCVLGSDDQGLRDISANYSELVVKHRYGSGSSGLFIVPPEYLEYALELASRDAPGPRNTTPRENLVVQNRVSGSEYGMDIVAPLCTEATSKCRVLARRKLRMRAGETDKAVTVSPAPFSKLGDALNRLLRPQGLMDVDVIVDQEDTPTVIDINPRFGGGYVFSHLAGADVPHYYLTQILGIESGANWANYEVGVIAAKHEEPVITWWPGNDA